MTDYGYVDVGKLADFVNNTIGGITANDIMRFPRADVQPVDKWISVDDIHELFNIISQTIDHPFEETVELITGLIKVNHELTKDD